MRTPDSAFRRLLVVTAVVILAIYGIVQAINRPVGGDVQTYRAEFTDVFGLRVNADVRVRGVQVGKVVDLTMQPSGVPLVSFTVRDTDELTERDRLAVKFQNLVGQRYLAITREDGPSTDSSRRLDPARTIPTARTVGSFDITSLFNGLRPVLQGADPAVFNTFATNLLHLLQGDEGVGIGDVLADVDRLTTFAADKKAMITVIIDNLGVVSRQLTGKSEMIATLMRNLRLLFDTLEKNLQLLIGTFGEGSKVFPEISTVLGHVFDLGLGGHDRVSERLLELTPDTTKLTETLGLIPSVLSTIGATVAPEASAARCSKGEKGLPAMGDVLLAGGRLTLCRS